MVSILVCFVSDHTNENTGCSVLQLHIIFLLSLMDDTGSREFTNDVAFSYSSREGPSKNRASPKRPKLTPY